MSFSVLRLKTPQKNTQDFRGQVKYVELGASSWNFISHTIHGTGIFPYMKTIKNQPTCIGKYTVRPMDGMGRMDIDEPGLMSQIPDCTVPRNLQQDPLNGPLNLSI